MYYWRIRTGPSPLGTYVFIKTQRKLIPAMIVDIAIKTKYLNEVFEQDVDEVIEVLEEEYYKHVFRGYNAFTGEFN